MRNLNSILYERTNIKGKQLGEALLQDEVRTRLNLKPFMSVGEVALFESKLYRTEKDRQELQRYKNLILYLEDRQKMLKIHKLELDRQIAWRVCFLNGLLTEAHRVLDEPIVITPKQDTENTAIKDDELHLVRKEKMVVSFSDKRIGSPKKLNLTPLQEIQRELNGIALLVRDGKNTHITDIIYNQPKLVQLEQLRSGKVNMPDTDFKNIQYRVDMIKGILNVFDIIGAEVKLDIGKAYYDAEIKDVFFNARGYNQLYAGTLARLTEIGDKQVINNFKKCVKLINLDKETTDKQINTVKDMVAGLKEFDYLIGNKLETVLFKVEL